MDDLVNDHELNIVNGNELNSFSLYVQYAPYGLWLFVKSFCLMYCAVLACPSLSANKTHHKTTNK